MASKRDLSTIYLFRGLAYVLMIVFLGAFHNLLYVDGAAQTGVHPVFLVASLICLAQFIFCLNDHHESHLFGLFLADAALATLVVKATGGSASPFVILFPLISLVGATTFVKTYLTWSLVGLAMVSMTLGVGFGPTILGNAMAILGTAFLGRYLFTTLKKTDLALEKSEGARKRLENLQKAILAHIPSGLMSVDNFGKIIQVNTVGSQILDRSEADLLGMYLREILPELDELREKLHTMVPAMHHLTPTRERKVVAYTNPDDEELNLGYSIARLYDPEDRSPIGTLVVFQDLTHIIKIESELRTSEKLAAVGKLAAGIAHEIRNPLASISGCAQMLAGTKGLEKDDAHMLEIIQRESIRLDQLITEFLEYVRPAKPKLKEINLGSLIEKVIATVEQNPKWQELECRLQSVSYIGQDPIVLGDDNKVTQVLLNLILNGGQAGAHNVTVKLAGSNVVQVIDDGKGIPLDDQKRIFEPFFTTKDKGTGLGLAISYKILESMEASIKVKSPPDESNDSGGTVFSIEFKTPEERHENAAI